MDAIERILKGARTIAVVGLSPRPDRDSHEVARYLQAEGYRIIPVNPRVDQVLGEKSYPDLASIPEPVDLVDVFRRPEEVAAVAREAVAIKAKALWLQLDVVNEDAARIAREGGLDVVMDRCTKVEHMKLRSAGRL